MAHFNPQDQEKENGRGAHEEGKERRRLEEAGGREREGEEGRKGEERSIIKERTHVASSFICVNERSLSGDTWSRKEIARKSKPLPAFASPLDDADLSYSPANAIRTILSQGVFVGLDGRVISSHGRGGGGRGEKGEAGEREGPGEKERG